MGNKPTKVNHAIERTITETDLLSNLSTTQTPKRNIIITGSNRGVGLAGSKILVENGHTVVCACRTLTKAKSAVDAVNEYVELKNNNRNGGNAIPVECDLSSLESIRSFVQTIKSKTDDGPFRPDTLVLNAGVALNTRDQSPSRTQDGFELTVGVNHLGHFALADMLIDLLSSSSSSSPPPRIVVTASPVHDPQSEGGNVGTPASLGDLEGLKKAVENNFKSFDMVDGKSFDPDKAYKDSKLCNIMFMEEASRRWFDDTNNLRQKVTTNAFSPGLIPDSDGLFRHQSTIFTKIFSKISSLVGISETATFGGECLSFMAVDPSLDSCSGGWYDSFPAGKHQLAKHVPSEEARDEEKQRELWDLSKKLIGSAT